LEFKVRIKGCTKESLYSMLFSMHNLSWGKTGKTKKKTKKVKIIFKTSVA
jgi:hypothetical protein